MSDRDVPRPLRPDLLTFAGLACLLGLIATLSLGRDWYTYATETDFVGSLLIEAQRFVAGEPLRLDFHPPLYPITLAGVHGAVNDWFVAGRLLSWIGAAVAIGTHVLVARVCWHATAGWCTLAAFAVSAPFLTFASFATSDVFFLALHGSALLAGVLGHAALAGRVPVDASPTHLFGPATGSGDGIMRGVVLWAICGVLVGLACLARSNGIGLFAIVLLALIGTGPFGGRFRASVAFVAGAALPILCWYAYARSSGSPLMPDGNHVNLALTYFAEGDDRISGDARRTVEGRFSSLADVLLHDPATMMTRYAKDLLTNPAFRSGFLTPFPLNVLMVVGLVRSVLRRPWNLAWVLVLVVSFANVMLINLKFYETRYYLFLLPLGGAAAGVLLHDLWTRFGGRRRGGAALVLSLTLLTVPVWGAARTALVELHRDDAELAGATAAVRDLGIPASELVIHSRKEHLAHYVGAEWRDYPNVDVPEDLVALLRRLPPGRTGLLYEGADERRKRAEIGPLLEAAGDRLRIVASGDADAPWTLYALVDR